MCDNLTLNNNVSTLGCVLYVPIHNHFVVSCDSELNLDELWKDSVEFRKCSYVSVAASAFGNLYSYDTDEWVLELPQPRECTLLMSGGDHRWLPPSVLSAVDPSLGAKHKNHVALLTHAPTKGSP